MSKVDFDKFGHCAKCHLKMIEEKVVVGIDGKPEVQILFLSMYDEETIMLDNGTQMRIAMCKDCKEKFSDKDFGNVMETVIKGWKKEIEARPNWTPERIKDQEDNFFNLKIVCKRKDRLLKSNKKLVKKMKRDRAKLLNKEK